MDLSFESVLSLNPLSEVSRRLGIRLTIRGGLVRRLVRTAIYEPNDLNSEDLLFRLTPFLSDIDIEHSGPREINVRVHDELVGSVPGAAAIRLEVRSEEDNVLFEESKEYQAFIPVLSMSLSSDRFHDPDGGVLDIATRNYRYRTNEQYKDSPLYKSQRDLEIFSMLLYLKALLEDGANPAANFAGEFERVAATPVPESGYLNVRMFYLLAGIFGVSLPKEENQEVLEATIAKLFSLRAGTLMDGLSQRSLIVSSWLGRAVFRFPNVVAGQFLPPQQNPESALLTHNLDPDQECFLESPWLDVSQGISDCAIKQTSFGMEFVHLLLELPDNCKGLTEQDLTACWLLKGLSRHDEKSEELVLPAITACHILKQRKMRNLSVRCNLLDIGGLTSAFNNVTAKIFLLRRKTKQPGLLIITPGEPDLSHTRDHFVYVHGIRSDPSTFDTLRKRLEWEAQARKVSVAHHGFSYPYEDSMKNNGEALARELTAIGAKCGSVTLFGHSMGGLICRLAILDGGTAAYKLIKRVIMFGTPNHGAVSASSLKLPLLWIMHEAAVIWGHFLRSPGIVELTQVQKLFEDPIKRRGQADGIEYVTIPGTCFNESRHQLDFTGLTRMMRNLGVVTLLLRSAYSPRMPHDGIVERVSVDLLPEYSGRRSEKKGPYLRFNNPEIEYAHIQLMACDRLDHLTVHTDKEVLDFTSELVFRDKLSDLAGSEFERDLWPFP